jgi:CheY-like chemotaxis protein
MDYFNYTGGSNSRKSSIKSTSTDSTPELPSTPTIFIHDTGKSPSRPTCIRYSASLFTPDEIEASTVAPTDIKSTLRKKNQVFNLASLSSSLPSPPTAPTHIISSSFLLPPIKKRRFSTPPHKVHSPRLHVLLVDDNNINLQILSRLLSRHMADAIEHLELVKSGIKALEVLKCRPFDLILMDIDMPILNGIETTKHIRSSTEFDILLQNRNAPIVAVTTNDSNEWRQTYTKIGMVSVCVVFLSLIVNTNFFPCRMDVLANLFHQTF